VSEQTPNIGHITPRTERLQEIVNMLDEALDGIDPDRNLRVLARVRVVDLDTEITYSRDVPLSESFHTFADAAIEILERYPNFNDQEQS
jgi:hypothetical protein